MLYHGQGNSTTNIIVLNLDSMACYHPLKSIIKPFHMPINTTVQHIHCNPTVGLPLLGNRITTTTLSLLGHGHLAHYKVTAKHDPQQSTIHHICPQFPQFLCAHGKRTLMQHHEPNTNICQWHRTNPLAPTISANTCHAPRCRCSPYSIPKIFSGAYFPSSVPMSLRTAIQQWLLLTLKLTMARTHQHASQLTAYKHHACHNIPFPSTQHNHIMARGKGPHGELYLDAIYPSKKSITQGPNHTIPANTTTLKLCHEKITYKILHEAQRRQHPQILYTFQAYPHTGRCQINTSTNHADLHAN